MKTGYWGLGEDAKFINEYADLNTFLTPGNFKCPTSATAGTLKHCPCREAFIMRIYYSTGSVGYGYLYLAQEIRSYDTAMFIIRLYSKVPNENPIWKEYKYIPTQIS